MPAANTLRVGGAAPDGAPPPGRNRGTTYNQLFHDMLVARRFLVSGRVQGVGFRYHTHAAAVREGVTGWVRNLDDGRVEALVEGDAAAVDRVEQALRNGPPGARVDTVTAVAVPTHRTHQRFSIT
jgi:acylphosphatase